ncbi:sensor histidine kinase [Paenibacillus sp. GCM10023252]|uniref:sensor histidine kinase n=1 Tax=Paenibacillus sp. GCM10023252 TaxID=3252649 RepID=UPI0036108004
MNLLYIVMFLSLWSVGVVTLIYNFKRYFWIGVAFLTGGMASFCFSIHLTIVPLLEPQGWMTPLLSHLLYHTSVAAMTIYFYFFPYAACVSGLWMGGLFSYKQRVSVTAILTLGAFGLLISHYLTEPWYSFDLARFRWWSGAYFGVGIVFFWMASVRESDYYAKKSKGRVALLFSAAFLWVYQADFIGFNSLSMKEWQFELMSNGTWKYNVLVILALIAAVIVYTVKYGFLGIKLRIEREKLDYSMRALTMGVAILNHSIKNEIQKINYLTEKTEGYIHSGQTDKSLQSLEQIHTVSAHLLQMVGRIKEKADDIVLDEQPVNIRELIGSVLSPIQGKLASARITVSEHYEADGEVICDRPHMKETISNLVHNAADALVEEGALTIRVYRTKKHLVMQVRDSGCGIRKEDLAKIFEPFYSTKKNSTNHGLGLSYCASVMQKHGGSITVPETDLGKGTTVQLNLPASRFIPADSANKPISTGWASGSPSPSSSSSSSPAPHSR